MLTVRGRGDALGRLSKAPFSGLETGKATEGGDCQDPKAKKAEDGKECFSLSHFNTFPKAFLHSGAVGSKAWGAGLQEPRDSAALGKPSRLGCEPAAGRLLSPRGPGFGFLFPGVCLFWVSLSFLLATAVRKFNGFRHAKIACLPPGAPAEGAFEL